MLSRQMKLGLAGVALAVLGGMPAMGADEPKSDPQSVQQDQGDAEIRLLSREQLQERVEKLERLAVELERQLQEAKNRLHQARDHYWVEILQGAQVPVPHQAAKDPVWRVTVPKHDSAATKRPKNIIQVNRVPHNVIIRLNEMTPDRNLKFPANIERAMMMDGMNSSVPQEMQPRR